MRVGEVAPTSPPRGLRAVWRLRYLAVCVALTALAFLQEPGKLVLDTKVDLTLNPADWLDRAMHLWDASGSFGQVQNQAYGYLWPMGPFFVVGSWLDLPGWVIQRLWWALLMCVAFAGVVRLAGRLGIGTPASRLVAGLAFALSPRVLTELGTISIEAWPMALAPWVLVPLVGLAQGASVRRAVAWSAVAVACAGGVNATAVLAVVPMALLWLATLSPVRYRLRVMAAWCTAVAAATLWWTVPLLILGRYSPRFLDYIETAQSTTSVTDLVTVVRGASHWLAYLGGPYGPTLPAGYRLATDTALVVVSLAVATLGIAGLARPGMPHRRFLVTSLLLGLALVGMGHATSLDGGLAGYVRQFLDGPGAPLRNLHKFDVVVRLPIVLGLAHLVGAFARTAAAAGRRLTGARLRSGLVSAAAVAGIVVVASPALAGFIPTHGSYARVPSYWYQAADWLDRHAGTDHVLVVPAARFPTYHWGRPSDEVIQALMDGSWAVRSDIPLTPPATIRLLDSIEAVVASGAGSPALADLLARSGVHYVLVRSDLDYGRSGSARPMAVRQALARSPGLRKVAGFGPTVGSDEPAEGAFVDNGFDLPVRSLEVFEVDRSVARVVAYDLSATTTVVGGPEALLDIAAAGQLGPAPAILAGDLTPSAAPGPVVITDSLRRREVAFGLSRDNTSATLTASEPLRLDGPAYDYLPQWGESQQTVARYRGIANVISSSSWAKVDPFVGSRPEYHAFAAIDGDPGTSWRTTPGASPFGQWLEVTFEQPRIVSEIRLTFDPAADYLPTVVTVRAGSEQETVEVSGSTSTVVLSGNHATRHMRVIIEDGEPLRIGSGGVGIAEIEIPDVTARRTLVSPAPPVSARAASVVLTAGPAVPSCFFVDRRTRCATGLARGSEDGAVIDRTFMLPAPGKYEPALWARPRPGAELDRLLDVETAAATPLGLLPSVTASSSSVADPAGRPGVVLDGDESTAWSPAGGDRNPWLRLTWLRPREVSGLRVSLAAGVAATPVSAVTVIGDGVRNGWLNEIGEITFDPPMRTDEITIVFPERPPLVSVDPYRNAFDLLPVAVGELTALPDPPNTRTPLDVPVALPCGSGPTLTIGGTKIETALKATRRDLLERREVPAIPCGESQDDVPLELAPGERRLVASGTDLAVPTRVVLEPRGVLPAATGGPVDVLGWTAAERRVRVTSSSVERILAVRENVNPGWRATLGGAALRPIVADGWQQGWILPAGASGEVVLTFVPDRPYRAALVGGAATLLAVLIAAIAPARRRGAHSVDRNSIPAYARRGWLFPAIGAIALLLVGGVGGAALIALALALTLAWRLGLSVPPSLNRRSRRRLARALQWWCPVIAMALAGWLFLRTSVDRAALAPQLAALTGATAMWLSVAVRRRRAGQRAPQR